MTTREAMKPIGEFVRECVCAHGRLSWYPLDCIISICEEHGYSDAQKHKRYIRTVCYHTDKTITALVNLGHLKLAYSRLEKLRQAMVNAHPDKEGGSHEAFIKARRNYEAAKNGAKGLPNWLK
jgi:hypothetical protein